MLAEFVDPKFLACDGSTVTVDGQACRLRVRRHQQRYPYAADVVTVSADPVDRDSEYYRYWRRAFGDDWSTDVLSTPELMADVLSQLEARNA